MEDRKLKFELVPSSCWFSNLRSILSKKDWDLIRLDAKDRAGGRCMICKRKSDRLEGHERWAYDEENKVQKLVEVISVCPDCHRAIHIGLSQLKGYGEKAEDHYIKVNGISYSEMRKDLGQANADNERRNKISDWKLDLTYLKKYKDKIDLSIFNINNC